MKVKRTVTDAMKGRIDRAWNRVQNLLGEKGQGLVDELRGIFDEMESAEVEVSAEDLTAAIEETVAKYKEVPEAVANAISAMKADLLQVRNAMNNSKEGKNLPVAVKNQIAKAIMSCREKSQIENAVKAVLTKNEITGLTFADVIDYAIVDGWGDESGLFGKLYKTPVTKFFYNEDDLTEADILAKQWDKDSESAKAVQVIATTGKTISTAYIYKKQRIANEDMDSIAASGNESMFLGYITSELKRQWNNTVIKTILIGDSDNPVGSQITTFESIGTKAADDIFTTITNPGTPGTPTRAEVWAMIQSVKDDYGYGKVLVVDPTVLAIMSTFVYASGGSTEFRGMDALKAEFGVADIIVKDLLTWTSSSVHAVCFVPQGYWVNIKKEVEVAYPNWEFNTQNFLFERNAGGAIHDLKSTAVLKEA